MSGEIYLIRTPVREVGALAYGGPIRLRSGRRAAYVGFRSARVAQAVAEFWGIAGEHYIEPWHQALAHEIAGSEVRSIVVFESREHFERYLAERERFDFAAHTVALHPTLVAGTDTTTSPRRRQRPPSPSG